MPNNCENTLTITGPQEDIQAFRETARSENCLLDMNNFVPMPEEIRNTKFSNQDEELSQKLMDNYGAPDWYEWANQNWGSKWGPYETTVEEDSDTSIRYQFLTAWAPLNKNAITAMSSRFPALRLEMEYEEPGIGFGGRCTALAGKITGKVENTM